MFLSHIDLQLAYIQRGACKRSSLNMIECMTDAGPANLKVGGGGADKAKNLGGQASYPFHCSFKTTCKKCGGL